MPWFKPYHHFDQVGLTKQYVFPQEEVVKSIGNPAGIGQGTGLGLRERERDGIGLGHYRLRASPSPWPVEADESVEVGPKFITSELTDRI